MSSMEITPPLFAARSAAIDTLQQSDTSPSKKPRLIQTEGNVGAVSPSFRPIPKDLITKIFSFLPCYNYPVIAGLCREFSSVITKNPPLWKMKIREFGIDPQNFPEGVRKGEFFRQACSRIITLRKEFFQNALEPFELEDAEVIKRDDILTSIALNVLPENPRKALEIARLISEENRIKVYTEIGKKAPQLAREICMLPDFRPSRRYPWNVTRGHIINHCEFIPILAPKDLLQAVNFLKEIVNLYESHAGKSSNPPDKRLDSCCGNELFGVIKACCLFVDFVAPKDLEIREILKPIQLRLAKVFGLPLGSKKPFFKAVLGIVKILKRFDSQKADAFLDTVELTPHAKFRKAVTSMDAIRSMETYIEIHDNLSGYRYIWQKNDSQGAGYGSQSLSMPLSLNLNLSVSVSQEDRNRTTEILSKRLPDILRVARNSEPFFALYKAAKEIELAETRMTVSGIIAYFLAMRNPQEGIKLFRELYNEVGKIDTARAQTEIFLQMSLLLVLVDFQEGVKCIKEASFAAKSDELKNTGRKIAIASLLARVSPQEGIKFLREAFEDPGEFARLMLQLVDSEGNTIERLSDLLAPIDPQLVFTYYAEAFRYVWDWDGDGDDRVEIENFFLPRITEAVGKINPEKAFEEICAITRQTNSEPGEEAQVKTFCALGKALLQKNFGDARKAFDKAYAIASGEDLEDVSIADGFSYLAGSYLPLKEMLEESE
ncbi:MAG: F-box protein [Waddliaceae bacterium]